MFNSAKMAMDFNLLCVYSLITEGLWYARTAAFVHSPIMEGFVWMRVPGDVVFAAGISYLAWFAIRLLKKERKEENRVTLVSEKVMSR